MALTAVLSGCASLGASGPSTRAVLNAEQSSAATSQIKIVDLTDSVARRAAEAVRAQSFASTIGDGVPYGAVVGRGDTLSIDVWEAPPAALFGTQVADARSSLTGASRGTALPDQIVGIDGTIDVPFVGQVLAAGRSATQISAEIARRLAGKANHPEVIVGIARNSDAVVTVVGDVAASARVPLTTRGERVLDVIATVGGVRQPINKTMIQIARDGRVVAMPLDAVIKDPTQNVRLQARDIVTALYQPFSFTALGAATHNAEIPIEGVGVSLAQALGRIGGLQDSRADVRGVFIFRLEDPKLLDPAMAQQTQRTPDGKIPVIYRVDMKNPETFFLAQNFPIQNRDVLYISNAPIADLQKFVNIVSTMAFSVAGIATVVP